MKRLFLLLFLMISFALPCLCEIQLRGYEGAEIPKGTFIPVISTQEISTQYCDEGTKVKFIAVSDLYLYDTNVIPQNTEFFGYVEKINEPVVGTNGSMVIKVIKFKTPQGYETPIRAYIYTPKGNLIGGELTNPATYDKKPHFQQGFSHGTLQYVPGATRQMGEHTVVASGADLIIVLAAPVFITQGVTN
ncbi:MAG TPA: hypothetical protein PLG15_06115 [Candidatus Gastranaerophilaceae bacterium]|nr:hypothetical protein [Candidatus Gastranaerophilaceae bacterium]HPT41941.1 hypothetical protein [Candidatus Gastranaerophilaceae bacterium]